MEILSRLLCYLLQHGSHHVRHVLLLGRNSWLWKGYQRLRLLCIGGKKMLQVRHDLYWLSCKRRLRYGRLLRCGRLGHRRLLRQLLETLKMLLLLLLMYLGLLLSMALLR